MSRNDKIVQSSHKDFLTTNESIRESLQRKIAAIRNEKPKLFRGCFLIFLMCTVAILSIFFVNTSSNQSPSLIHVENSTSRNGTTNYSFDNTIQEMGSNFGYIYYLLFFGVCYVILYIIYICFPSIFGYIYKCFEGCSSFILTNGIKFKEFVQSVKCHDPEEDEDEDDEEGEDGESSSASSGKNYSLEGENGTTKNQSKEDNIVELN